MSDITETSNWEQSAADAIADANEPADHVTNEQFEDWMEMRERADAENMKVEALPEPQKGEIFSNAIPFNPNRQAENTVQDGRFCFNPSRNPDLSGIEPASLRDELISHQATYDVSRDMDRQAIDIMAAKGDIKPLDPENGSLHELDGFHFYRENGSDDYKIAREGSDKNWYEVPSDSEIKTSLGEGNPEFTEAVLEARHQNRTQTFSDHQNENGDNIAVTTRTENSTLSGKTAMEMVHGQGADSGMQEIYFGDEVPMTGPDSGIDHHDLPQNPDYISPVEPSAPAMEPPSM